LDEHGRLEVPASVAFVSDEQDPKNREDDFFGHMYSDLRNKRGDDRDAVLKETAVLVPKNNTADRVNDHQIRPSRETIRTQRSIWPASRRVACLLM
jgi:hypothetical protein